MNRPLNQEEQAFLLRLARKAVEAHLEKTKLKKERRPEDPIFSEKRGAFVTLKQHGQLRGCIGYPLPVKPLYDTVKGMAVAAATQDFRFLPLTLDELPTVSFEISVLSLPRTISDPEEVEVGTHGIIISQGDHSGLLLPQVPVEWGWDRETYLNHGCQKAGLPGNAWRKGAAIQVFTAQVFADE